ncbi:MAG: hypothetical protein ABIA76_04130 [Candidatus Diapherotrites archaeon]
MGLIKIIKTVTKRTRTAINKLRTAINKLRQQKKVIIARQKANLIIRADEVKKLFNKVGAEYIKGTTAYNIPSVKMASSRAVAGELIDISARVHMREKKWESVIRNPDLSSVASARAQLNIAVEGLDNSLKKKFFDEFDTLLNS